jgi:insulin-like growth factor 2 mRNA-binding protein 1
MSKLYVGNLPSDVNEGTLRQLFQDHGLSCSTILVKRGGYAFVDCPDQSTADRAIDKLNGKRIFTEFHVAVRWCSVHD